MSNSISIVLIQDNRILRDALATLIRQQPGFNVLAASANSIAALPGVHPASPRIFLVDFSLSDDDSLRLIVTLHRDFPADGIIVMGLFAGQQDIAACVRAGASGFVMKDAPLDDFLATIRRVAKGAKVLPTQLTHSLFSQIIEHAIQGGRESVLERVQLTERERQVIDFIDSGLSNKEIAAHLGVTVHTVKSHVHNLLEKLALHTRLEVAAFTRRSER